MQINDGFRMQITYRGKTHACDITSLVTSVFSTKHLGLAIHLHDDYGSNPICCPFVVVPVIAHPNDQSPIFLDTISDGIEAHENVLL